MVEQFEIPLNQILSWVNGFEMCSNVTFDNLRQPDAQTVSQIYLSLLQEFGFSTENLLQLPLGVMEDLQYPDMFKDLLPTLAMQSAVSNLLTKVTGQQSTFGLQDLRNPHPKRTQKYLSILQNFWNFCNEHSGKVDDAHEKVQKMVNVKKDLETDIEKLKDNINLRLSRAVEEKAEEKCVKEENANLQLEFKALMEELKELNTIKENLKAQFEQATQQTNELKETLQTLEKDKDNLQGAVEGAAVLGKLDTELAQAKEELESKEKRSLEFKKRIEMLAMAKDEFSSVLDFVQQIAQEKKKTKDLQIKIKELNSNMETLNFKKEETDTMLRELQTQTKDKSDTLARMKNQWMRKKIGKDEEIEEFKAGLEEARKQVGAEQMAAVDLSNKISDVQLMEEEIKDEIKREAKHVRAEYAKLLEALEMFNGNITEDYEKITEANRKLSEN